MEKSVFAPFDYDAMALESEKRLELLKDGLEKAKGLPSWTKQEQHTRYAKIKLLEEQIYEESLDLNLFREKAAERRKS